MTFYIIQHKKLSWFSLDSFLTCNVLKITCSIPMEDFSLNFKVVILITIFLVFCLKLLRKSSVLKGVIGSNFMEA